MDSATVLWTKGIMREHRRSPGSRRVQNSKANCIGYDKEVKGAWNPYRLLGSGRHFKLTPEVLAMIEEWMQADDETTATQLMKMVNAAGYEVSQSTIV